MIYLKKFIETMEASSQSTPMMQRWAYGTKELERQLSERIIGLCRYSDIIPEESLESYANVLIEALEAADAENRIAAFSFDLLAGALEITQQLIQTKNPQKIKKGAEILSLVSKNVE